MSRFDFMGGAQRSIQIDAAMGCVFDAIGDQLLRNGLEDSSGARRAATFALEINDIGAAARIIGCSETVAEEIRAKFFGAKGSKA